MIDKLVYFFWFCALFPVFFLFIALLSRNNKTMVTKEKKQEDSEAFMPVELDSNLPQSYKNLILTGVGYRHGGVINIKTRELKSQAKPMPY